MTGEGVHGELDPLGFVVDELIARGALVDRAAEDRALVLLPAPVARELAVAEAFVASAGGSSTVESSTVESIGEAPIACGLGAPLLDRLVTSVRATVPVASIVWEVEPPRLAQAERLAERLVIRNGVAQVLGTAHVSATYLAGMFAWSAEADDRYEGMVFPVANAATAGEPDPAIVDAFANLVGGRDPRVVEARDAGGAAGAAVAVARRAASHIGPRLDEVGAAVARRRDRERARIDDYFGSMIAETRRPRGRVGQAAIDARIAALHAEHAAKQRDLAARYTLRIRLEPIALAAIGVRIAEVRVRLRRRKGERELVLHVPPTARAPDALACAACEGTTRAPLLCDDALHVLCETCAPDATGRPRCPACQPRRVTAPPI